MPLKTGCFGNTSKLFIYYLDARVLANRKIAFTWYITCAVQFLDLCIILCKAEIGNFSGARCQIVFLFHKLAVKDAG